MADKQTVLIIDGLRKRGQSYDEIHSALTREGGDARAATRVLNEYARTLGPDGRPREQINPGDPDEVL